MNTRQRFKYRRWAPHRLPDLLVSIKIDTTAFQDAMYRMAAALQVQPIVPRHFRWPNEHQRHSRYSLHGTPLLASRGAAFSTIDVRGPSASYTWSDDLAPSSVDAMTVTAAQSHEDADREMAEWRAILDQAKSRRTT